MLEKLKKAMENSSYLPQIIPFKQDMHQTIPQKIDTIISGALQGVIGSNKTLSLEAASSMLTLEELRDRIVSRPTRYPGQAKCSA